MPVKKPAPGSGAPLSAVAYYRYSSHRQGEQSIEGQRAEAVRWSEANGYTIIKDYADRAMTGMNDDREQFQLMLRELEQLRPAALILWKVDRMGRNKEEIAFNKHRCKKAGVKVVYTAESIPDSPEGVILESVLEGMAEYYSLQLSQNVRRGQRVNASKGLSIGGIHPLGYATGPDKRFVIDPDGAAAVRQIFDRYIKGETQAEIVEALNAQGLRTARKRPFTHNSLRTILRNQRYTGVYTFKDEVRIDGGVPAIIDEETFRKAQDMMKQNKRAPAHKWSKADYLLTGKLFCGNCGAPMVGVCGTSRNGATHNYYSCSSRHGDRRTRTCKKRNVRKGWIEELVLRNVKALIFNDALLTQIAEQTYAYYVRKNDDSAYTDSLKKSLAQIDAALANLLRAVEAGIFNETTRTRMDELEAQRQQLRNSLESARLRADLSLTQDSILYFLRSFRELDFDDRASQKRLIATFVNSVFVYDDRVTITFNYSGDNRTITLAEIDAATPDDITDVFDYSAPSCTSVQGCLEQRQPCFSIHLTKGGLPMTPQEERALRALLAAHGARYPRMEACDAVKLLYQSEHGGGHLIADPESSLARLREEWARTAPRADVPLCEDIGGGMVRIALAAVREEQYPLDALNRDFVRSAALHRGDRAAFLRKLALLRRVACEGGLPFSADALKDYLAGYLAAGCPPASHSAAYRAAYAPAYRVVLRAACLPLLLMQAEELAARQGCVLVALDGRCASGKSTLADRLHRAHGWPVVHMDDFFLRPAQRTPARYAQPGGNIDHERFLEEVLAPLRAGREALYRPFDCGTMTLGEPVRLAPAGVVLVEGSYSCHPALWDGYDLHAFLTVGPEEQRRRIRARNGAAGEARFAEQWIPLEERYFAAFDLPARCEYFLEL